MTLLNTDPKPKPALRSRASYSALSQHRICPQRWYYNHVLKLESDSTAPTVERDMGGWWHALRAVDSLQRGAALSSLRRVPDHIDATDRGPRFERTATTDDVLAAALNVWDHRMSRNEQDIWQAVIGEPLPLRLVTMYERWRAEWEDEIRTEKPLAVEALWTRKVPVLSDGTDLNITLVGYVDEVYQDTRRGLIVVRDHKAAKALGTQTAAEDMMDSQLQLYAWGISPEVSSWGLGRINATAYDRARMVRAKTPVLTTTGNLSKSVTDYDLATYLAWAVGPDGNGVPWRGAKLPGKEIHKPGGVYVMEDAVIERLSTPSARSAWFQRTLVPLNVNLIRSHLKSAIETVQDIRRTLEQAEKVHEAPRNFGKPCNWCEYASLCRAQLMGGPDGEYPLEDHGLRTRDPKRGNRHGV